MADIEIRVQDFGAESHPDDFVKLYAPSFRPTSDNTAVISTAPRIVPLVNGSATVAGIEPGPLTVEFYCRNVVNSRPVTVEVPNVSTAKLVDLMQQFYQWSAGVITQIDELIANAMKSFRVDQAAIYAEVNRLVESGRWDKGTLPLSIGSLDNAPAGVSGVNLTDAAALGAPVSQRGNVRRTNVAGYSFEEYTTLTAAGFTEFGRVWDGTKWLPWANKNWFKGALWAGAYPDLQSVPAGAWEILRTSDATAYGLPAAAGGILEILRSGNTTVARFSYNVTGTGLVVKAALHGSSGWSQWKTLTSEATQSSSPQTPALSTGQAASGSGLKVVPLALSVGNGDSGTAPISGSWRIRIHVEAPIFRWRLCVSTRNPRNDGKISGSATLSKVTFGDHAGNGSFADTPTVVAENVSVPADGTPVKLPWVNSPLGSGRENLVAYDYSASASPFLLNSDGWQLSSGTSSDVTPPATYKGSVPFDWWIEAETYATTPVVAGIGDSLTCGAGASLSLHDSWLSQLARKLKAIPVHYSASGDSAYNWSTKLGGYKQTRWLELSAPDAVIFFLGSNDIAGTITAETMQARVKAIWQDVVNISPNVYAMTIMPRDVYTQEQDAARIAYNEWLKKERVLFRDVFDASAQVIDADGTIQEIYDADNTHLNTAGYAKVVEGIARPITAPPVQYQAI